MNKLLCIVLGLSLSTAPFVFAGGGGEGADDGVAELSLWFHGGTADETEAMRSQIERFNASQSDYRVVMTEIPGGAVAGSGYNDAVNAAAVADDLPDILDLDGPNLYNYAWAGYLHPLDQYMSAELRNDMLPSLIDQGTYNGRMYAIGQYDSGLALVGRVSLLEQAGVRIPRSIDEAWSREEFFQALTALQALPAVEYAIDLKMNYGAGEWFTYGFSPVVQSFGGDLIDRSDYQSAEGVLNGPAAVEAMTAVQSLFERGYSIVSPPDDNEFVNGKAALGWLGHWMWNTYSEAFGDDVVVIPMPRFGEASVTGMGSWAWAISSQSENPQGAWAFLEFILQPEEILSITDVNGAVPGRATAFAQSDLYSDGGALSIFVQQLQNGIAVPRPKTPGYPAITAAFYTAMDNIIKGADVQTELDIAVDFIEEDVRQNDGYPAQ
ncbi:MAG: extracellular solute-binding protein [Spirochaetales bacterium]|nr:extracellular solute-binding protein [Spirochaetales bacterium]